MRSESAGVLEIRGQTRFAPKTSQRVGTNDNTDRERAGRRPNFPLPCRHYGVSYSSPSFDHEDNAVKQSAIFQSLLAIVLGMSPLVGAVHGQPGGGPQAKKEAPSGFGPKKGGPKIGDKAPDFQLKFLDAKETFKLSDNFDKRPTVLIFHSFT